MSEVSVSLKPAWFDQAHLAWYLDEGHRPEVIATEDRLRLRMGFYALGDVIFDDGPAIVSGYWRGEPKGLETVAAHAAAGPGLERYEFTNAPYHSALHVVTDGTRTRNQYCGIHNHPDVTELNVIIPSSDGLWYEVYDHDEWKAVDEPTVLWFPSGRDHCAIARQGSGVFFVVRFPDIEGVTAEKTYSLV